VNAEEPELWQLTAVELAAAYRTNRFTPVDALEATLARLRRLNPICNAVVTLDAIGAGTEAEASTQRWREGAPLSALDGVPVTIKDNILVRAMRSTWGSALYADFVPPADELPVERLRRAGAILLGKTNVPEFTLHGYTDNAQFGPTRNPWDLALTPGGSSGGAVTAVACGIGPIALATDGGGSIRRPCGYTGLVGFKPSRGVVRRSGGFPRILGEFEVVGPIARTVDDVIVAMRAIGHGEWEKILRAPIEPLPRQRIIFAPTFGDAPVDPVIADAVAALAGEFARQGHEVTTNKGFSLAERMHAIWPVISSVGLARLVSQSENALAVIGPLAKEVVLRGSEYKALDYVGALEAIDELDNAFAALFDEYDFLLTPTAAAMPWAVGQPYPDTIGGREVGPRGHAVFTPVANAIGLPAISLPCPVAENQLPIGFQLCAARGRDPGLLQFARNFMARKAYRYRWPPIGR